jgi:histidine ammonia-lyase
MPDSVTLDGRHLEIDTVCAVAAGARVTLGDTARHQLQRGAAALEAAVTSGEALYGITTGFGPFARRRISDSDIQQVQVNLIRSHAVGYGEPIPIPVVRAMLVLRAHSLTRGYSGVRVGLVEALLALLNHDFSPVVPEKGSVGASGDLAPLAHVGLALLGEGEVFHAGERMPTSQALARAGLEPYRLGPKEGLALINGTQYMTGFGILACAEAQVVLHAAQVAGAMSLEAMLGSVTAFDAGLHDLRGHPGQRAVAANLVRLLDGSQIVASHAGCQRVQDAYSMRCMPQILGASQDALRYVEGVLQVEADAVTDNPLVFPEDGRVISGGNFHGQPVAMVLDHLGVALAEIGSVAERRLFHLLYDNDVEALPRCLVGNPGVQSGLMMLQYLAAALVSENRTLGHAATLDNVVTGGGTEDHNSMGSVAAARLPRVLCNVRGVVGAELLAASQALEFHAPLACGRGTRAGLDVVRRYVPRVQEDRALAADIETLARETTLREVVAAADSACGGALQTAI